MLVLGGASAVVSEGAGPTTSGSVRARASVSRRTEWSTVVGVTTSRAGGPDALPGIVDHPPRDQRDDRDDAAPGERRCDPPSFLIATIVASLRAAGGFPYLRAMASVVVVEDDPEIRRGLIGGLTERGHAVTSYPSGLPVLELVVKDKPDVILLDLGLPDIDGRTLLAMIRAVSDVPVIVVTADDDDQSIVATLDEGADDYVTKPFGIEQVAARIRAVLRRSATGPRGDPIEIGELMIDPRARRASLAGSELELARREFDLLLALAERVGRGRHQARAARRGVAAAVRRRRPDPRRPLVVAAAQAGRDGRRPALPAHRAGGGSAAHPTRGSGPDEAAHRLAGRGDDISGDPRVRDPAVPAGPDPGARTGGQHRPRRRGRRGAHRLRAARRPRPCRRGRSATASTFAATSVVTPRDVVLGEQVADLPTDPDVRRAREGAAFTDLRRRRCHGPHAGRDGRRHLRRARARVSDEQLSAGVARAWIALGCSACC